MMFYAVGTSRVTHLPGPLPRSLPQRSPLSVLTRASRGSTVAVFPCEKPPFQRQLGTAARSANLVLSVGGIAMLWWKSRAHLPEPGQTRPWYGPALKSPGWSSPGCPFRAALLIALYLDNVLSVWTTTRRWTP